MKTRKQVKGGNFDGIEHTFKSAGIPHNIDTVTNDARSCPPPPAHNLVMYAEKSRRADHRTRKMEGRCTLQETVGVAITGCLSQAFRAQFISTDSHVQLDRSTAQRASLHILAM